MKRYEEWWPLMQEDLIAMLATPYRLKAEWDGKTWPPAELDCSEMVEVAFRRRAISCPDGSWIQHAESLPVQDPRPGDLGFFCKPEAVNADNPYGVYHAGILGNGDLVYEARAKDKHGRYGMVITRPREAWEKYKPFQAAGGWRRLKVLL